MQWIIIAIIVLLVVICISLLVANYNKFIKLRNQSNEAFSTMDIYLKKRYDMVPNLVEVVKSYAIHERETLEQVIQARNMAMNAQSFAERTQGEDFLTGTLKSLYAVSENFKELNTQLAKVEEDIANSRKYYNGVVKIMNNKIEMFPSNIFAAMFGFRCYPFFSASEFERQNVQVKF